MKIPFLDLRAQYASIKTEIDAAVTGVLETGQFVLGPEVAAFESEFAVFCRTTHAIGVNNGTSALHLSLLAAEIGPGDEVITAAHTFVATVAAIYYCGARPVLVDIDPRTYTMQVDALESAVTAKTKAVIPVHLYGQPADMDPILAVAKRHKLLVIEDACQAHGAEYQGRRVGGLGDLGCFSFYPGKNLGAAGEGGIVVTNNDEFARRIRMLRNWGQEKRYHHDLKGYNYRLEGIQGAVLRVKLRHLLDWTRARQSRACLYDRLVAELGATPPFVAADRTHVYHIYPLLVADRKRVQMALREQGIETAVHYPFPVHLSAAYRDPAYGPGSFPVAERVCAQELSLPLYPEMSDSAVAAVVDALKGCGARLGAA